MLTLKITGEVISETWQRMMQVIPSIMELIGHELIRGNNPAGGEFTAKLPGLQVSLLLSVGHEPAPGQPPGPPSPGTSTDTAS